MIHKTSSLKNEKSFFNSKKEISKDDDFSKLLKRNFLRKCLSSKAIKNEKFYNELTIEKEENKIENESLFKKKKNGILMMNNNKKKEKEDLSHFQFNQNINDKKGYNNFILKSEINPKYNNDNINNINKLNLLYNYFGEENKELKYNLEKKEKKLNEKKGIKEKNNIQINNNIKNSNIYNKINHENEIIKQNQYIQKMNKMNNIKNLSLLIKGQIGCRLLQKIIEENPEISNLLFISLINNIENMCTDLFGNYVIQKLLMYLNGENLEKFTLIISKNFLQISSSNYGTRVIQKYIEIISIKNNNFNNNEKNQNLIYLKCFTILNSLIIKNIKEISKDNNSCHIIIKFVSEIPFPANDNLYKSIYDIFFLLCKDKHGCCVIQKCFDCGIIQQKNILYNLTNKFCSLLICDQFGNYVIQYVVQCNVDFVNKKLLNVVFNNLLFLCKEKYASNVLEKFIYYKSAESQILLNKIINDEFILFNLITDQYGNYIIQRIFPIIDFEKRIKVFNHIIGWIDIIKKLSFGARLISKLCEKYQEFNLMINNIYGQNLYENHNENIYVQNINNNYISNQNFENLNIFLMNNYLISPYYINNNNNIKIIDENKTDVNKLNGINPLLNINKNINNSINQKNKLYYHKPLNKQNYDNSNTNENNNLE